MVQHILPISVGNPADRLTSASVIEDWPAGYPRYAVLGSLDQSFGVFRRFSRLRARLALHKQDRLSCLEARLDEIDFAEPKALFLGSIRRDRNQERKAVLGDIDDALKDYDDHLARADSTWRRGRAARRNVSNLQNWLACTGCICRAESVYLEHVDDLMAVGQDDLDNDVSCLQSAVEDFIIWFTSLIKQNWRIKRSRDPNLHIFPKVWLANITRILLAFIPALIILTPVVILSLIESLTIRLWVVLAFTLALVTFLSVLAKARLGDLCIAGATYTAVLVVYISGTSSPT